MINFEYKNALSLHEVISIIQIKDLIDDLLQRVEKLEISKTQRQLAKDRYHAVGAWLSKDEELLGRAEINIYPQGSLSISTTVVKYY